MLGGAIFCSSWNYSRHAPPSAFAFAILQTQSRRDIRDPAPFASIARRWTPAFMGMTVDFRDCAAETSAPYF
jgi:hypothetical protein